MKLLPMKTHDELMREYHRRLHPAKLRSHFVILLVVCASYGAAILLTEYAKERRAIQERPTPDHNSE